MSLIKSTVTNGFFRLWRCSQGLVRPARVFILVGSYSVFSCLAVFNAWADSARATEGNKHDVGGVDHQPQALLASSHPSLRDVIAFTLEQNPAVQSRLALYQQAHHTRRAAKGGYLPSVDLSAEYGDESTEQAPQDEVSFNRHSATLTVTQLLFDGFATMNRVRQQGYFQLQRYYEFLAFSEAQALETAQAFYDVLRYRSLVDLAEQNYVRHRKVLNDIRDRVESGLGRGVDLDQATARLALAESNLLTEATNLHDVSVRYQRLVGFGPKGIDRPLLNESLIPLTRKAALEVALDKSPVLMASIESVKVANKETNIRKSPYFPKLDLRFRKNLSENRNGIEGRFDQSSVDLVLTYNLFRGGSDRARLKESYSQLNQAKYDRDQVCRDVRQTLAIAYNDIASKTAMLGYLDVNRKAITKAREAYKKQFDIGQRTLLDLLDTQNEYFELQRAYVNTEMDLDIAKIRALAAMGRFIASLSIDPNSEPAVENLLGKQVSDGKNFGARCPAEAPLQTTIDKNRLMTEYGLPVNLKNVVEDIHHDWSAGVEQAIVPFDE